MISIKFKAVLFDLDGTLINSHASVERAWRKWSDRNDINFDETNKVLHGRPAAETMRLLLPGATDNEIKRQKAIHEKEESRDVSDTEIICGALEFISTLSQLNIPWAIVTSGAFIVASARIRAVSLPEPRVFVTPEKVSKGKPDPEPFLLGAKLLGIKPEDCVVFEDSPAGLISGDAANCRLVGVLSQYSAEQLPKADIYVKDFEALSVSQKLDGQCELRLNDFPHVK
ncbi:HAD-IA family hydrolase [Vibrio sp. TH_r3]|uniref:HAD-IA family hydrolase n=1 Tax=Vibrio sp. TH_r3 TaxID=3082084 RepID=UPI002952BA03|nr:HAD-IA family hydrolase [Vibrio sp. TH_r3]MDV7105092.1 HAD-IA family hydrolase [Vibrio sp. TH_r3]